MENIALIVGGGQDAYYIACELRRKSPSQKIYNIVRSQPLIQAPSVKYILCDITDHRKLRFLVNKLRVDTLYFVAAIHGPSGFQFQKNFVSMLEVHCTALQVIMETILEFKKKVMIYYLSSVRVFGNDLSGLIDTESRKDRSWCLYSTSKLLAEDILNYYSRYANIHCGIFYLSNHESIIRSNKFFLQKMCQRLSALKKDGHSTIKLKSLDFFTDWSYAGDLMHLMVNCTIQNFDTFLLASGNTVYAHKLYNRLCETMNIVDREYGDIKLKQTPFKFSNEKIMRQNQNFKFLSTEKLCQKLIKGEI